MILRRITDLDAQVDSGDINEDDVIQSRPKPCFGWFVTRWSDLETDGNYTYMLSQAMASGRLEIRPRSGGAGLSPEGVHVRA